jgi:hypothetical protein
MAGPSGALGFNDLERLTNREDELPQLHAQRRLHPARSARVVHHQPGHQCSPRQDILYLCAELTRPCLGNIRSTSPQSRMAPRKESLMRENQRM